MYKIRRRWKGNLSKRLQLSTGHWLPIDHPIKKLTLDKDGNLLPHLIGSGGFLKLSDCNTFSDCNEGLTIEERIRGIGVSITSYCIM